MAWARVLVVALTAFVFLDVSALTVHDDCSNIAGRWTPTRHPKVVFVVEQNGCEINWAPERAHQHHRLHATVVGTTIRVPEGSGRAHFGATGELLRNGTIQFETGRQWDPRAEN